MRAAFLTLALLAAGPARADDRDMLNAGMGLTIGSSLLIGASVGVAANAVRIGGDNFDGLSIIGGGSFVGVGIAAALVGVPLWIVGGRRVQQRKRLAVAPTGLVVHF